MHTSRNYGEIPAKFLRPRPEKELCRLAAVDYARLHDKRDVFEDADVFQGITGHGDDVGVVARLVAGPH
jgi:hypothetical protein